MNRFLGGSTQFVYKRGFIKIKNFDVMQTFYVIRNYMTRYHNLVYCNNIISASLVFMEGMQSPHNDCDCHGAAIIKATCNDR